MAEAMPGLTPYRFGFNNPISFADPSGLFEQNGGPDDPDKRKVQYDENGKPTGVHLTYSSAPDNSTLAGDIMGLFSGGGGGVSGPSNSGVCESCPTLPTATVSAPRPEGMWRVNGQLMDEKTMFNLARHNQMMSYRLLKEEFGTSTAIKFMQFDVNGAIFDFSNNYVTPMLTNIGPGGALKFGLAGAKYGGLFVASTGWIRVSKAAWGIKMLDRQRRFCILQ